MGLWKHGVEQILAGAGMQNQETERKTLARQITTKLRRGAMCSPSRKPAKGDIILTGSFYVEQEKAQHRTETNANGPFQGLRSAKRWVKEITPRRRCDLF